MYVIKIYALLLSSLYAPKVCFMLLTKQNSQVYILFFITFNVMNTM